MTLIIYRKEKGGSYMYADRITSGGVSFVSERDKIHTDIYKKGKDTIKNVIGIAGNGNFNKHVYEQCFKIFRELSLKEKTSKESYNEFTYIKEIGLFLDRNFEGYAFLFYSGYSNTCYYCTKTEYGNYIDEDNGERFMAIGSGYQYAAGILKAQPDISMKSLFKSVSELDIHVSQNFNFIKLK